MPDWLHELHAAGLAPRKSLGQHFLLDEAHLARIVDAAELAADDVVLEIGPGPGPLTERLAAQAAHVIAVEADLRLVEFLHTRLAHHTNIHLLHGDILHFDPCTIPSLLPTPYSLLSTPYKTVANLPYYITSAVLRHLLEAPCSPDLVVVTVQREVAERVVARPPDMSLLAVSVQLYAEAEVVGRIPAGAFYPPPQIESAILRLRRRSMLAVPLAPGDVAYFFAVVRAGFGQKRKQLHNSLASGLHLPAAEVGAALIAAEIDGRRRAETLTLEEWGRLVQALPAA